MQFDLFSQFPDAFTGNETMTYEQYKKQVLDDTYDYLSKYGNFIVNMPSKYELLKTWGINMWDDMDFVKRLINIEPTEALDFLADRFLDYGDISSETAAAISEYAIEKYFPENPDIILYIPVSPRVDFAGKYLKEHPDFYKRLTNSYHNYRADFTQSGKTTEEIKFAFYAAVVGIEGGKDTLKQVIFASDAIYSEKHMERMANTKQTLREIASSDLSFASVYAKTVTEGGLGGVISDLSFDKLFDCSTTEKFYDFCKEQISSNSNILKTVLKYFPNDMDICELAVERNGDALKDCPIQTVELIDKAYASNIRSIIYIDRDVIGTENYLNKCLLAIDRKPQYMQKLETKFSASDRTYLLTKCPNIIGHFNTITKDMVSTVLKINNKALQGILRHPISDLENKTIADMISENIDENKANEHPKQVTTKDLFKDENMRKLKSMFL